MRAKQWLAALIALTVMGVSPAASAESPIQWQVELKAGPYKPSIDGEFANAHPFETIYGESPVGLAMVEVGLQVYRGPIGVLAISGAFGFSSDEGTSLDPETNTKPGDATTFNVAPTQLSLVYEMNALQQEFEIPLVFFGKGGVDYWLWWVRDANDEIAAYEGAEAMGGTMGWHAGGGVRLLLDWLDPGSAQSFDQDIGVNNSYLFAEYTHARVDDFGSATSFRLGNDILLFGLSFEM